MASTTSGRIFCSVENAFFPADQFIDDPLWGKVHNILPRHTLLGTLIGDSETGVDVDEEMDVDDVLGDAEEE